MRRYAVTRAVMKNYAEIFFSYIVDIYIDIIRYAFYIINVFITVCMHCTECDSVCRNGHFVKSVSGINAYFK